jgi:hypothetical protein
MPRPRAARAQLDLEWTDTMRWEDLPVAVRERVGERLADVLHQVARSGAGAEARRDA